METPFKLTRTKFPATTGMKIRIVSLLKGHILPIAARNWNETWLEDAGPRDAGLIVLADANHCGFRIADAPTTTSAVSARRTASLFSPISSGQPRPASTPWMRPWDSH